MLNRTVSALVAIASLATTAATAEPVKIRVGFNIIGTNITSLAWREPETIGLKLYGKTYTVELTKFQGSGTQLTAFASGNLDIGMGQPSAFVQVVNNAGVDAVIVSDSLQDRCDGVGTTQPFYVRKDAGIDTPADLKGGVPVAVTTINSGNDISLRTMLGKVGRSVNDIKRVEVSAGSIPAFLMEGKVVAGPLLQEQIGAIEADGRFKKLFTQCDAMGPVQMNVHFATKDFIVKNRAATIDLLADLMHATRWFLDAANNKEALRILGETSMQSVDPFAPWIFTEKGYYHDKDLQPNVEGIKNSLKVQLDAGVLKANLPKPVEEYIDQDLLAAAKKRYDEVYGTK